MRATGSVPSGALIDAFCDQVWLQDGLAASSLASYRRDLTAWAGWLEHNGRKHLLAAERGDVDLYLAAQFRAKAKSTSIGRRLSSLRRFYRLQAAQGAIASDPTLRARAPCRRAFPKKRSKRCSMHRIATRRSACATARCWKRSTPRDCASRNLSA